LALVLFVMPLAGQEKVDLVVLLDSSKSMFTYYNDVIDYVLSGTVREYMRFGDTFHLITFADSTTVEMTQALRTEQDLRSVIARLYLLYPLGRNTDLVTALRNVQEYVSGLPASSSKYIILITDGMHSPAPGTPYADMDTAGVSKEISEAASRIKANGWILKIVRIPFDGTGTGTDAGGIVTVVPGGPAGSAGGPEATPTSPGSGDYLDELAKAGGADITTFDPANGEASKIETVGLPRISIPPDLGEQGYSFTITAELHNTTTKDIDLKLVALLLPDGTDILAGKPGLKLGPGTSGSLPIKVRLPGIMDPGAHVLSMEPRFAGGARVNPARLNAKVVLKRGILEKITGNRTWLAAIIVLIILIAGSVVLIVRYIRRAHRKTEQPIVEAVIDSTAAARHHKDAAQILAESTQTRHSAGTMPGSAAAAVHTRDAAQLLASSTQMHHSAAVIPAAAAAHTKDAATILSGGRHEHRDSSSAANLLAEARAAAPAGAEVRAVSILDAWRKKPSSRLALPSKEILPRSPGGHHATPLHYEARIVQPGAQRIVLHVRGQNPNIGRRNIHIMHAGSKKSIGGRGSDFLVFLLPIPRNVAQAYYDGVDITVVPGIPEYFPDSTGIIENCLGREIRIVNTRGKELFLYFTRYVPPIDSINKLLHCIESPGLRPLEPTIELDGTGNQGKAGN
jgi:hypothetical protein